MVDQFPTVSPADLSRSDRDRTNRSCHICLEEFSNDHKAVRLPCLHIIGRDCIKQWLRDNSTCPVCRTEIRELTNEDRSSQSRYSYSLHGPSRDRVPSRTEEASRTSHRTSHSTRTDTRCDARRGLSTIPERNTRSRSSGDSQDSQRTVRPSHYDSGTYGSESSSAHPSFTHGSRSTSHANSRMTSSTRDRHAGSHLPSTSAYQSSTHSTRDRHADSHLPSTSAYQSSAHSSRSTRPASSRSHDYSGTSIAGPRMTFTVASRICGSNRREDTSRPSVSRIETSMGSLQIMQASSHGSSRTTEGRSETWKIDKGQGLEEVKVKIVKAKAFDSLARGS